MLFGSLWVVWYRWCEWKLVLEFVNECIYLFCRVGECLIISVRCFESSCWLVFCCVVCFCIAEWGWFW